MEAQQTDWKAEILSDFAAWLEDLPPGRPQDEQPPPNMHALADLYSEVAALRREVAVQNRSGKKVQVGLESAAAVFSDLGGKLKAQLAALAEALPRQAAELEVHSVVVSFLNIRDSLVRTRSLATRLFSPDAARENETSGAEELVETLAVVVRKFDLILEEHRISRIDTVGRPFDPATMKAAGTRALPGTANGTVVEEVRGGFLHDGRLLRTAEVFVNWYKEEPEEGNER